MSSSVGLAMILAYDLAIAALIIFMSLAAERFVRGGELRLLIAQIIIKIIGLLTIGSAWWFEERLASQAGYQKWDAGLIIWFVGFALGQVFIALSATEQSGKILNNRRSKVVLAIGRRLQFAAGLRK